MSRLENNMEVLGIPNHEQHGGRDPKHSEAEQNKHDLSRLPGLQVADYAYFSEALSEFRAQFQTVSCLLHESHACSWLYHACFAEAARAWWSVRYCHATGKLRGVRCTAAPLSLHNTLLQSLRLVCMPWHSSGQRGQSCQRQARLKCVASSLSQPLICNLCWVASCCSLSSCFVAPCS